MFEARFLIAFRARNMRVLIIEDDAETAAYVLDGLRRHGHIAEMIAAGGDYDVIVVDRMLPGLDGLAIVKMIRGKIVETHISRLRAKVGSGGQQQLIHTIRGVGYVIRSPS